MVFRQIDQLKGFTAHLGKARTARIRYAQRGTGKRQPAATNIENGVMDLMQDQDPQDNSPVVDILVGVANADEDPKRKPLSVKVLFVILQCVPLINSREVGLLLNVTPRQAQRYVRAIKLAMPFIKRAMKVRRERKALYEQIEETKE